MSTLHFLGRLHVLVLHLPIGILMLAVLLEILARRPRFQHLQGATGFVWAAGALSAVATVVLGYLHAGEGGFEGASLSAHRLAGTSLALLACLIWALRAVAGGVYRKVWWAGSAAILALLMVTGHFGGNMTHGETYLAEYAPAPLRGLLAGGSAAAARPRPASVEAADLYLDVVAPALQQRCGACHSESKRKGDFSVASYESLLAGGKGGQVIVAGKPDESDLIRRIRLDPAHEDFMPRDGKTPLSPPQVEVIAWWISVGVPRGGTTASFAPTAQVKVALAGALGFGAAATPVVDDGGSVAAAGGGSAEVVAPPGLAPPDAQAVAQLEDRGFLVRPISMGSPLVQVDYTARRPLAGEDLAALARICPQIHALNLRNAGVVDQHLETIGTCTNLAHLRLELNPLTDAGVARLRALDQLEYLNLYGTRVSDAGLRSLAGLAKLQELYLWQTQVTTAGIAELKRARAGLHVDSGFDTRTFPEGPKVIPVVN